MIRLAATGDEAAALRAIALRTPCLGARRSVDMRIAADNPKMPYRFYRAGEDALIELTGRGAVACGLPRDGEEAALFLRGAGVSRLLSDGWMPPGWRGAPMGVMRKVPSFDVPPPLPPPGLDAAPTVADILSVLESSDGPLNPSGAREGFAADICARRNRGLALVYGVRQKGAMVCTAGIYALAEHEAYIACVETLPAFRGKGLARALVRLLCHAAGALPVTLMCEEALQPFYIPLGFETTGNVVVMAGDPAAF